MAGQILRRSFLTLTAVAVAITMSAACGANQGRREVENSHDKNALVPRLSDAARANHEALFPNHRSTLKATDPELIEIFDNFAFDEVLRYGKLETRTRMMVILSSLIASQALGEYKVMLGGALNVGVTPIEAKEILYQAIPYVGLAKVYDFIHATNEILQARGVKLPLAAQSTTSPETRYAKGLALQKEIFGEAIDRMYRESPKNQLHIQQYLSDNCFGDFLTRKGLDIRTRELLTFSMLLSLGGCEAQLKGHIQGNVNVGNDKETLLATVTQLLPYVGYPRTLNAIRTLNEVLPE
jgi:4-carboxymuconolactone decarboxylase